MNIVILVGLQIICLVSLASTEPPVGDGYPTARSSHDHHNDHGDHHHHHHNDHQRSLSQEYGPPSFASRNAISSEYGVPNARSSQNTRGRSQFPPATVRVSFNQRFSSAAARNSNKAASRSHTQEHTPNSRGISQEYGAPSARSLSQEYGVPSTSARGLSSEHGVPKSSPSEEFGVPVAARSNQKHSSAFNAHSQTPSQDFSSLKSQSGTESHSGYTASSVRSNNEGYEATDSYSKSDELQGPSETYGTPKHAPSSSYDALSSRSLTTSYGAPSERRFDSHSQDYNSISNAYTAPSKRDLLETYGAPNTKSPSQEYGVPSTRTNQITESSFSSPRSAPSSTYLPASRSAMPSQQYGVPEQEGYENARARALNELLNQEPANYDFAYQIEDAESGSDFGHTETREENRAEGSYFVVLPDGTKQTVEYEADEGGFRPRISVEPADAAARMGGYDDNAQDLDNQGPY